MARKVTRTEREELPALVQYLNLEEMRDFCRAHDLPMFIRVETGEGRSRQTGNRDRKDVVLDRILALALEGRRVGATVYSRRVVSDEPLPAKLTGRVKLHHGQYDKKRKDFVELLKDMTDGAYENDMISRFVLRDFWTAGKVPTLKQFADAWVAATAAHTQPRPEGAYLVDLARGEAGEGWKRKRIEKARRALDILNRLV